MGDDGRRGEMGGEEGEKRWVRLIPRSGGGGGVGEGEEGRSCQTSCFIVSGHIAYFDII